MLVNLIFFGGTEKSFSLILWPPTEVVENLFFVLWLPLAFLLLPFFSAGRDEFEVAWETGGEGGLDSFSAFLSSGVRYMVACRWL